MFLKPARAGLIVRDPISRDPLPQAGAEKPDTQFWRRRIADGDVIEAKPEKRARTETRRKVDEEK